MKYSLQTKVTSVLEESKIKKCRERLTSRLIHHHANPGHTPTLIYYTEQIALPIKLLIQQIHRETTAAIFASHAR